MHPGRLMLVLPLGLLACLAEQPLAEPESPSAREQLRALGAAGFRAWERRLFDEQPRVAARGPHGGFIEVFVSPSLTAARGEDPPLATWPAGVTAVGLTFASEDQMEPSYTLLAHRAEDGWQWLQIDADDEVIVDGPALACLGCHAQAPGDTLYSINPQG